MELHAKNTITQALHQVFPTISVEIFPFQVVASFDKPSTPILPRPIGSLLLLSHSYFYPCETNMMVTPTTVTDRILGVVTVNSSSSRCWIGPI